MLDKMLDLAGVTKQIAIVSFGRIHDKSVAVNVMPLAESTDGSASSKSFLAGISSTASVARRRFQMCFFFDLFLRGRWWAGGLSGVNTIDLGMCFVCFSFSCTLISLHLEKEFEGGRCHHIGLFYGPCQKGKSPDCVRITFTAVKSAFSNQSVSQSCN